MWGSIGTGGKRHRGDDGEAGDKEGSICRLLHQFDARIRAQEGLAATYFLAEGDQVIVPAMVEGNTYYENNKPEKGQPHMFGPRRTTLAAAFLRKLIQIDLTKSGQKETELIQFFDQIAGITKNPTVVQQLELLKVLVAKFNTPKLLEGEISLCQFFKTKKSPKYVFSIVFQQGSPFQHTYDLVRVGLMGAGATLADGPPPPGPGIRAIPKK